ncbi:hypothetical protein GCM10022419_027280 [Nonomuraea rosea]|uniref:Uncharacterized protein n=2 Tax=Nonomuraea rosea TaxID=638574 RepID=A0ABP6W7S5_9ACTN
MTCVQCGHPHPALITRRPRRARYSCRSCGAVFRPGPMPEQPASLRPASAPALPDPLAEFMPGHMVRWVRAQGQVPDAPDRATLARWYQDFDALAAAASSSPEARAAVERVGALDLPPAKIPAFSKVCGALHAACYDPRLAAARLGAQDAPPVLERVAHLRHWLATAGRSTTWLAAPAAAPPAPEAVETLLPLPDAFTAEQVRTLFCALFGVEKGPSLPGVRERFGDDRIHEALRSYLKTGDRPLRAAVADELDAT